MHASYYSASLLACWMRFILLPSHRQKTLTFTCQFQTGERGQRGANVGSGWGEKLRCHCRRLPSLCIWCTQLLHRQTEPDEYINTNKRGGEKTRPARNWIGVARPSNIGMRVNVGLIRTGALNSAWTKTRAFGLPDETYHATQPGFSEAHYKQSSGVFKTRARSINR